MVAGTAAVTEHLLVCRNIGQAGINADADRLLVAMDRLRARLGHPMPAQGRSHPGHGLEGQQQGQQTAQHGRKDTPEKNSSEILAK